MAVGPRKISIKWKLFTVVAVLISAAILTIVSRTTSIFREDKEAFVKELSAKLASSTSKNFLNRITTLQDKLVIFISSRESLAHTGAKVEDQIQVLFSRYQEFISVGFLVPGENGKAHAEWVLRNPLGIANTGKWPADYEKTFLSALNLKSALANGRGFWRIQAPDGTWLSVLGFSVQVSDVKQSKSGPGAKSSIVSETKTAWIVGIMPNTAFDDLLNDFSTGLNAGFVVDDQGVAIANSDVSSRWKNLKTHPLVEEVLKKDRTAETTDSTDANGRAIIGSFEYIPKMNLAAVVTTPRDKAFEAADTMSRDIIVIGFLILAIALAAAVLLSNYVTGPLQKLAVIAAKIGAGDFKTPIDVTSNDEIGDLASSFKTMEDGLVERDEKIAATQTALVQSEKMSAFGQLSAGIAHEVKNPLAGILGHAQLAIGKITDENIKKHLEVIEKETRRCKQIVENLMKFARAEKASLIPTDLAQAAQDTINLVDHQLTLAGCKIYKDFQPCPMVEANSNMLQQVLLNLMVNASHAMENAQQKNVTVRVVQAGKKAQIQVEDTGTGIPPEVQKKMFEPFFTTKPAGKGTGLGLSVSIGIVKDHKGEIYIKSEMGKGTTFFIDLPIPEGALMPTKPIENTHGGVAVTTPAPSGSSKVPLSAPSPTPVPAPMAAATATAPAPASKGMPAAAPASTAPKTAPIPNPIPVTASTSASAAAPKPKAPEPSKVISINEGPKKGDLPKGFPKVSDLTGTLKKPLTNDPTPPPPADAENPGLPTMSASPSKLSAPVPKNTGDVNTLGGKKPVDITKVALPKPPEDDNRLDVTMDEIMATQTMTRAPGEVTRTAAGTAAVSQQTFTEVGTSASKPADVGTQSTSGRGAETEFKVKVKRPKLKV